MLQPIPVPNCIGIDDTPVWMIFLNDKGEYAPALVAWHNFDQYHESGFLTLKTFGTKQDAESYLRDFWDSYWRLYRNH